MLARAVHVGFVEYEVPLISAWQANLGSHPCCFDKESTG